MASQFAESGDARGTILGHPKGLFILFFAEMWERFSYYGMRALLVFYLTKHWLFSDERSSVVYGAYTALVYITPVIGGYLADRYLGQRKAVLYGAVLLTFGHFLMGFEGAGGQDAASLNVFWLALAFIIVGSGFLKANISVIVGQLYPRTDLRRDGAYTIFYMGINLGAALGSLLCGYLGETYGWSYGFGAAGVGMLLGLVVFVWGKPLLMGRGEAPDPAALSKPVAGIKLEWLLYLSGLVAVAVCWWLVQNQAVVGTLLGIGGTILILYVLGVATFGFVYGSYSAAPRVPVALFALGGLVAIAAFIMMFIEAITATAAQNLALAGFALSLVIVIWQSIGRANHDRDRIFAAMFLIMGSILFWALFEQAGSSLNLLTDRHVAREVLGWNIPASMFQSLNAIYIVLLAPLFAWLWTALGRRGLEPSAPAKFGLACVQLGAGFLVLVAGGSNGNEALIPLVFIFLIYFLHTTGELCLSPVGLSAMNRLAPAHMASLIMGTWFFASATGNFTAGLIAAATGSESASGEAAGKQTVLDVYSTIGWIAVGVGVAILVISPLIKKLMHLNTLSDDGSLAGEHQAGVEAQEAGIHPATS
ncbi:peptide MFS transporter [Croceibacterium sp. LX-88]|jgi:POT family proton-dependent oligopeptide transporter|uniref:Peptide MFS transporter n=1 Tax=Croceibacterium selenioxidans TaxID=2838833 RepID=A0ABS5W7U1_9SPHN|nr:peptide MFS transporter [Croceibacterium selenioxidans]MBT2135382.1 peptide MFS transporter [Croceibacterium selenioxidans]